MESFNELYGAASNFAKHRQWRDAVSALGMASQISLDAHRGEIRNLGVYIRNSIRQEMSSLKGANREAVINEDMDIIKATYRISARDSFDDFLIFTEWNRPQREKFYIPRRKQLYQCVDAMQGLADGRLEFLGISMPPGTGKTTLAMFFLDWMAGRAPEKAMLIGSHSSSILQGMYEETLRHLDPEGEYLWGEAFEGLKVAQTNALNMRISVGKAKRFANFQYASVGSNLAGKVRAQGLLYLDDLVGSLEEALNVALMEKLWNAYKVDYRQRKMANCPELMIATRWSVNDPLGRLFALHENNPKAKFIAMPALDDKGESNFDYGGDIGFTTKDYERMREDMGDELSWNALYMQQPIERDGLLYDKSTLRRFYELPDGEPDGILSVCDTSNGKGDYNAMPVGYVYGTDHYIFDVGFTDDLPGIADEFLVNCLVRNNVHKCQFESNNAGERIADKIQERLKDFPGCRTKITKRHTQENKETKIVVNSDWVKQHCLFLDESMYQKNTPYWKFIQQLTTYSIRGKNAHDDAADAMAQYALFVQSSLRPTARLFNRNDYGI